MQAANAAVWIPFLGVVQFCLQDPSIIPWGEDKCLDCPVCIVLFWLKFMIHTSTQMAVMTLLYGLIDPLDS